ncbi:hypothetical protein Leryth_002911 [Lithospermum erythrorhizon]|nr:hypothetical protein Leryth_002911 [Lithospermum erythrorhizon]
MGRAPCCDKNSVKKGPWAPEEDAKLKDYIETHGFAGNWIALPPKIGLKRCGKSCRLRWLNYLRPNIKHGGFTEEEDKIICNLYISIGSRWVFLSIILMIEHEIHHELRCLLVLVKCICSKNLNKFFIFQTYLFTE